MFVCVCVRENMIEFNFRNLRKKKEQALTSVLPKGDLWLFFGLKNKHYLGIAASYLSLMIRVLHIAEDSILAETINNEFSILW